MRVQVNLASRPFVELRPFFLRLRLLMGALAVVGLALAIGAHLLDARAARQQAALDHLRQLTINEQQGRLHTEQRMRQPGNARVLDRAHFLNALFLRKSFSWTAVMMDLEDVLPNGVQVTSIEPQTTPDGNVVIRLRVAGERANAVQLVRNLERSRRFLQSRLANEASQLKENGARNGAAAPAIPGPAAPAGVEFDILANYNPLPTNEAYTSGHARLSPVRGSGKEARADAAAGARGNSAAQNLRRGYPADGMVLKPYNGPAPKGPVYTPPQGAPR